MSKTDVVLFLGAGFSKSISNALPLGKELLEKILFKVDNEARNNINSLLPKVFLTQTRTACENAAAIQPFELLLAIVQRSRSHQLAGRPALEGIEADGLWRKLVEGVAQATRFEHRGYKYYEDPDTEFGQFIAFLRKASRETRVSIVTTNYDLIADKAAQYVIDEYLSYSHKAEPPKDLRRFQYGYSIREVWTQSVNESSASLNQEYKSWARAQGIPVYKLHGSTNWAYCNICKELDLSMTRDDVEAVYSSNTLSARCRHCGSPYEWLLIPPVPNKSAIGHPVLERVWRAAEEALETARLVIFVGYSLPPADPIVLEMVATARLRSRQSNGEPWRYWVFDRDESVCRRYEKIFESPEIREPQEFKVKLLSDSWEQKVEEYA